jgi:hypothetical protein
MSDVTYVVIFWSPAALPLAVWRPYGARGTLPHGLTGFDNPLCGILAALRVCIRERTRGQGAQRVNANAEPNGNAQRGASRGVRACPLTHRQRRRETADATLPACAECALASVRERAKNERLSLHL